VSWTRGFFACVACGHNHGVWERCAEIPMSAPPTEPAPVDDRCDVVIEKLPAPAAIPREMRDTRPPPRAKRLALGPCYFCEKPAVEKLANGCAICAVCKRQNENRPKKDAA
jgi:hypothetical protein